MKTTNLSIIKYLALGLTITLALVYLFVMRATVVSAQQGVITVDNPTAQVPTLSIRHNNTVLEIIATDNNLDESSWQNAGPFVNEQDCDSDGLVYNRPGASSRFLTLTEADNGQWYCFKVGDRDNNTGYAKYQVVGVEVEEIVEEEEVEELSATVTQEGSVLILQTNIDPSSRQVVLLEVGETCIERSFNRQGRRVFDAGRVTGLSWRDNGKRYCFKVSADGSDYIYIIGEVSGIAAPTPRPNEVVNDSSDDQDEDEDSTDSDEDDDEDDEDGDEVAKTDDDEDGDDGDDNLRFVGIGVVVLGILAIIAVVVLSKRQSDQRIEEDGEDDF